MTKTTSTNPLLLSPRKALNVAFLRVKPLRLHIESFKENLIKLLDQINVAESEEFHKNIVSKFLDNTYYSPNHYLNTKGRNDLVIHNSKEAKSSVGVIIEAKSPTNKAEFPKVNQLNSKALQEIILYYLRERITHKNLEIKHLLITNIYEWFIFDAAIFEKYFAQNKSFVKQFADFEEGRLSGKKTDFFYKEIAEPFIETLKNELVFTHFDLRDYEKPLRNIDKKDDKILIALYKILSPEHLLKLPFANDSNSLDKAFYAELLHIIGLTETKIGGKKLIDRPILSERNSGAILENAIVQLDSLEKIARLDKPQSFGDTMPERLFNVGLELTITWINRILFLKLLEAQLVAYHRNDPAYSFLNLSRIRDFDSLNSLFFSVLARKPTDRHPDVQEAFKYVPYLNSSLFEVSDIEDRTIVISNLQDDKTLPILASTVLTDNKGKKRTGRLNTLEYLFAFLEAYDFASEGSEDIQEDNKRLINASVLGLIFEKINGYKDGSFFTPGFITMYMCRETIRRAVLQKFNIHHNPDEQHPKYKNLDDVYDAIGKDFSKKEANEIINSLKICDPAVGSGHFLVSALNEMIAIKSELKILLDRQGKTLRDYVVKVVNDELIVTDDDNQLFEYHFQNQESQRVQETLFHEKQTIIENCLFGVDINPNSVKICRLRLWIELLKNAYFKNTYEVVATNDLIPTTSYFIPIKELETLPNIDINIKCGNSLISRFGLETDMKQALQKSKWNINTYKNAVDTYRNAKSKDEKRQMERLIKDIKSDFSTEINKNDALMKDFNKKNNELYTLVNQVSMFETDTEKIQKNLKISRLEKEVEQITAKIEDIKSNKIYENAFEWRFEFPEVLNNDGDFVGFDVVIGNPPYIRQEELGEGKSYLKSHYKTYSGTADLYVFFVEKAFDILRKNGNFVYIMPNKWLRTGYGFELRKFLKTHNLLQIDDFGDLPVFDEATAYPSMIFANKSTSNDQFWATPISTLSYETDLSNYIQQNKFEVKHQWLNDEGWNLANPTQQKLLQKLKGNHQTLERAINGKSFRGILTGLTEAFVIDEETKNKLILEDAKSEEIIKPFVLGRDIKPYANPKILKYLILFEKGFTKSKMQGNNPEKWFQETYPSIYEFMIPFKEKAIKRTDKGDFWWEIRACDYYEEFSKPKIMYQKFQVKPCFIYDEKGLYCNDSMWIITEADKTLFAILNSKIGWYLIANFCTAIQNGYQLIFQYFGQIPIPIIPESQQIPIIEKVNQIIEFKQTDNQTDTNILERQIDQLVYELYDLTAEEIGIIEGL